MMLHNIATVCLVVCLTVCNVSSTPVKRIKDLQPPPTPSNEECAAVDNVNRFDCNPEPNSNEELCTSRGCCWGVPKATKDAKAVMDIPYCFYPNNYGGLSFTNVSDAPFGKTADMQRTYSSPYGGDIPTVRFDFKFETQQRLRVRIYDPNNERFEPPYPEVPDDINSAASDTDYDVVVDQTKIGFQVVRKSTGEVIFNTQDFGTFIFSDQYIQLSTLLPTSNIYGLGEHKSTFLLNTQWTRFTMFNRDQAPGENTNLYGAHPFYLSIEKSGSAHGVFLRNSNAMDVLLQPTPALTYRTIGGILDLYFFLGPTPTDVFQQYSDIIGKPHLPPYWGLGFHLCRYGYGSLDKTKAAFQRTRDAGIPYDVQWNDLDYMQNQNDFTYDTTNYAGLPDFVNQLHELGMHYVPLIDPGVSGSEPSGTYPPYDRGVELGIFVKNSSGLPFIGKVWNPVSTVWPDFTNPDTNDYWLEMLTDMYKLFEFDGAWIDMNEPSNFVAGSLTGCESNSLNNPPFTPGVAGGQLISQTLCMDADQYAGKHYNVHNLYGISEAIVTNNVLSQLRQKRPFIISRSTFAGHGKYAGHWSGDISSSWYDMVKSIPDLLAFSMYGVPLMGADICGFNGDTNEELCERWMELGAFYPFSRNHNVINTRDQDPAALGEEVANASKKALLIRYYFLPYLYTLFAQAHANGTTVARALLFEFPSDPQTYAIDYEFLWGSGLLIIPVLEQGKTEVTAYLPKAVWYDYYTSKQISNGGENVTLSAPLDTIPLLLRGGTIFPAQVAGVTTTESRQNNFELLVVADENGSASGSLYWDDGDTIGTYEDGTYNLIHFTLQDSQITGTPANTGYSEAMPLGTVTVLGVGSASSVSVNGADTPFTYDADSKVLKIENLSVSLSDPLTVSWS